MTEPRPTPLPITLARCTFGGALMGLANLVPGISGGTMLLAAGVYERFINAIADITRLKLRVEPIAILATVVLAAGLAIAVLAGLVKVLVVEHRWVMYSLFIGLTLGGAPIIAKLIKQSAGRITPAAWTGAAVGFVAMALLAFVQASQPDAASRDGLLFMFLAGVAGASAMILPGVSGGYLLLLLGAYVPLLSAIDAFKDALVARDTQAAFDQFPTLVPVGVGVILGVVVVAQLLKLLLAKAEQPTLGFLLGLLLGAVVGLWPFQRPLAPEPGDILKGQTVVAVEPRPDDVGHDRLVAVTDLDLIEAEDWPTERFTPAAAQIAGSIALIIAGFAFTVGIGFIDRAKPSARAATQQPSTQENTSAD